MKVLAVNKLTDVTASTSNANYPVVNLLDDHPKKIWKATASSAVLTFTANGVDLNGFVLFNTNATGITFILRDPNGVAFEVGVSWESGVGWASSDPSITQIVNLDGVSGAVLVTWEKITGILELEATLVNNEGENVQAGVASCGELISFANPVYGLTEALKDFSIVQEQSNGSFYVKDRDVVRIFTMEVNLSRDDKFQEFIFDVAKVIKSNPVAWVVTDLDNSRWLVYARFSVVPSGRHYTTNRTILSFSLQEVL